MMFVTVFYAVYDPANGELTYANGGHNLPVIIHADGSSTVMPGTAGIALGIMPGAEYQENTIALAPGDTVIFYSDGVTEAVNETGDEFGMDRLAGIFADGERLDCQSATGAVFDEVAKFAGQAPQFDDITCLVLHRSK